MHPIPAGVNISASSIRDPIDIPVLGGVNRTAEGLIVHGLHYPWWPTPFIANKPRYNLDFEVLSRPLCSLYKLEVSFDQRVLINEVRLDIFGEGGYDN